MSSHREAPEISKDPVADSTDLYAFVSPDKPGTVTLIANYIPLQEPSGGPNFYEFGDDVLYEIHIDNNGDSRADISFQFRFSTQVVTPETFLYNTGPITSLSSPNWNRRQSYSVSVASGSGHGRTIASGLSCPPCNIGPLSTPNYGALAAAATHDVGSGITVFAGQRAEAFYVDLGSIFDLGNLRPFQTANVFGKTVFNKNAPGVNATNHLNVHSIAIQVPITALARTGKPVIGVWTTASRQKVRLWDADHGKNVDSGPFRQVSRLANPLVNEVLIPMGKKDQWNSLPPSDDKRFASYFASPGFSGLLPTLYPGVFPHLDALNKSGKPRADIEAIFLTGIPAGIVPGFTNLTGPIQADVLRLNTSIPPATSKLSTLGVVGGDLAGFPNGRRPIDDVVTIELRALAGLTYPLIDKTFVPDAAAKAVTDGLDGSSVANPPTGHFPYLGNPYDGYHNPS